MKKRFHVNGHTFSNWDEVHEYCEEKDFIVTDHSTQRIKGVTHYFVNVTNRTRETLGIRASAYGVYY
jgi:hypothetical protein